MPESSYYRTPEQEMAYHRYLAEKREYDRVEALRSAAPDMLAALKALPDPSEARGWESWGEEMLVWQRNYLLPAIAKAEGRS